MPSELYDLEDYRELLQLSYDALKNIQRSPLWKQMPMDQQRLICDVADRMEQTLYPDTKPTQR